MGNDGIQVLNISNVNALGKTVLNDGKLLELVQKYPFLYNPRVRGHNDNDYELWAWKNINAAFNRSYENDPNAAFSIRDLMGRWNVLKPLIQCLSKAYDLDAIPQFLRKSVVKISNELEDQSCNAMIKPNNCSQNLLLRNKWSIAQLPIDKRLALEKEVLDLILFAELENKQAAKLDEKVLEEVKNDTEELLNDIGFQQVLMTSYSHQQEIFHPSYSNQYTARGYMKSRRSLGWVSLKNVDKFIKPFHIRVKRINIEDYLPLAQIIQMNKIKNADLNGSNTVSPCIFD